MMTAQEIQELLARQRAFFQSGRTLALDFRLAQLAKLCKNMNPKLTARFCTTSAKAFSRVLCAKAAWF